MKKLFLLFLFCVGKNAKAVVVASYAKTTSTSTLPTGMIVLISVISVLIIAGIIWLIVKPIRRRRLSQRPKPPLRQRVIRPLMRPRRRVIIVR